MKVGKNPSHQSLFNYTDVPKNAAVRKQEVEALQKRVNVLQNELRREIRKNKFGDHVSNVKWYNIVFSKEDNAVKTHARTTVAIHSLRKV